VLALVIDRAANIMDIDLQLSVVISCSISSLPPRFDQYGLRIVVIVIETPVVTSMLKISGIRI
jgi:hypothetical protein